MESTSSSSKVTQLHFGNQDFLGHIVQWLACAFYVVSNIINLIGRDPLRFCMVLQAIGSLSLDFPRQHITQACSDDLAMLARLPAEWSPVPSLIFLWQILPLLGRSLHHLASSCINSMVNPSIPHDSPLWLQCLGKFGHTTEVWILTRSAWESLPEVGATVLLGFARPCWEPFRSLESFRPTDFTCSKGFQTENPKTSIRAGQGPKDCLTRLGLIRFVTHFWIRSSLITLSAELCLVLLAGAGHATAGPVTEATGRGGGPAVAYTTLQYTANHCNT